MALKEGIDEQLKQAVASVRVDAETLREFVHGAEEDSVELGGVPTDSLRRFMAKAEGRVDGAVTDATVRMNAQVNDATSRMSAQVDNATTSMNAQLASATTSMNAQVANATASMGTQITNAATRMDTQIVEAAASAAAAASAESGAASSRDAAAASRTAAAASESMARKWANNPENAIVQGAGATAEYSAYHWAKKSAQAATGGPEASPAQKGLVPSGGTAGQVYSVNTAGTAYTWQALTGVLPGMVVPFSGSFGGPNYKHPINRKSGQPDLNYALCDGGTYTAPDGHAVTTPNMVNRMIVGAGGSYAAGSTGGAASATTSSAANHTHTVAATGATTLSIATMPPHNHAITKRIGYTNTAYLDTVAAGDTPADRTKFNNSVDILNTGGGGSHTHSNSATGAAGAHGHTVSTMPPYYALAYVMAL